MALKIYKKKLNYSYSFGIFPTIELLTSRPTQCKTILISTKAGNTKGISQIKKLCKANNIDINKADKAISKLAIKDKTLVIGVFEKYTTTLKSEKNHIVLVNPSLPGNLGTIIRSAVGFGVKNVAIIKPASDIFDPKTIRASMGAAFKVNFKYYQNFEAYQKDFPKHTIYPFILDGTHSLETVGFKKPATLVFGNEGEGLPESFKKFRHTVKINHSNQIESLNLATAVGIALYKLYKQ